MWRDGSRYELDLILNTRIFCFLTISIEFLNTHVAIEFEFKFRFLVVGKKKAGKIRGT